MIMDNNKVQMNYTGWWCLIDIIHYQAIIIFNSGWCLIDAWQTDWWWLRMVLMVNGGIMGTSIYYISLIYLWKPVGNQWLSTYQSPRQIITWRTMGRSSNQPPLILTTAASSCLRHAIPKPQAALTGVRCRTPDGSKPKSLVHLFIRNHHLKPMDQSRLAPSLCELSTLRWWILQNFIILIQSRNASTLLFAVMITYISLDHMPVPYHAYC